MTKKIELKESGCTDVRIIITKEWQHPAGTLKPAGTILTVTNEYAAELVGEGIAELKLNKK